MKEMIYGKCDRYSGTGSEILDNGFYKSYEYFILNLYSHPTAYICLDKSSKFYGKSYDEIPLECHGELTFSEDSLRSILVYSEKYKCEVKTRIERDWIIGWNYAHLGDYFYTSIGREGKKWATHEILNEVKEVINNLAELEKENKELKSNMEKC